MNKLWIKSLFCLNLLVIIFFWWSGSSYLFFNLGASGILIAFGRLTGLVAEYFILILLVLVSRIPFIEKAYGFDKLNRLHRFIGYGLLSSILLHPILLIYGYALANKISISEQAKTFFFEWEHVMLAFFGLFVVLFIGILSLPKIRRFFRYESWHTIHLFMYVAIGLFFGHQIETANVSYGLPLYYWLTLNFSVFGALIIYRFIHPFLLYKKHKFRIEKLVQENKNIFSVYITGELMNEFKYDAGQYIHISFLTRKMWQPHPFSISKAYDGKNIRISIKSLGDYTSKIKDLKIGTKAIIEGPFGLFTEKSAKYDKYLLIAGGIGITPIRALAESVSNKNIDTVILYSNRAKEDFAFKTELENFKASKHYILSDGKADGFESGKIDEEKIITLVPDFKEREIFICGPVGMINTLSKSLLKVGVSKKQIHFEKFAY